MSSDAPIAAPPPLLNRITLYRSVREGSTNAATSSRPANHATHPRVLGVDPDAFTLLSLCSGIGGLDLGVGLAVPAARTICHVEIEAPACALLEKAMSNGLLHAAPIWTDLRRFDGKAWRGAVDCIVAGYPCQPFSVAGKRLGESDERHLWPHVARIVGEVEPVLVFLENVPGHLQLGFERVVADLRGMGYSVAAGLFTAEEVGAPHRRERLFILGQLAECRHTELQRRVAYQEGTEREARTKSPSCGGSSVAHAHGQERRERDGEQGNQSAESGADVANGELSRRQEAGERRDQHAGGEPEAGCGGMGDSECAGLEGRGLPGSECPGEWITWPPGPRGDWTGIDPRLWPAVNGNGSPQPPVRLLADGPPARTDLLRALGNAVVPAVAAKAFRTLAGVLNVS